MKKIGLLITAIITVSCSNMMTELSRVELNGTIESSSKPLVPAETDIDGDGDIDDVDTVLLNKLTFTITDGEVTLTGSELSVAGTIILPATYNGLPVTAIANGAFQDCTLLTTVTIPESVTEISSDAFNSCTGLTSITMLPTTAPTAAVNIFDGVSTAISLTYPDGTTGYDDAGTVWVDASVILKDGDINGDGVVGAADTSLLNSLDWDTSTPGVSKLLLVPDDTSGAINIPGTYNGNPVTVIKDGAFLRCTLLTSITIPSSVITMESSTFYECTGLETLTMNPAAAPSTATTPFTGIKEEINIRFSTSATGYDVSPWAEARVGDVNCDNVINSADVEKFNKLTFTESASEAVLTNCETSITDRLRIPQRSNGKPVTAIGRSAFENCTSLYSVILSAGITTIGDDAFKNSTNLKAFTMMQTAAPALGSSVFSGITEAYLTIPAGATGYDTAPWNDVAIFFREGDLNGDGLVDGGDDTIHAMLTWETNTWESFLIDVNTEITGRLIIPLTYDGKPVTMIDDGAFVNCVNLTSVVIPDSLTSIGMRSFWLCSSLTSVTIPNSVTEMGTDAFKSCTSLPTINIPGSVESIGKEAFMGCTALTSVNIASGVAKIDQGAFEESGLTSVNIPGSVSLISSTAFMSCTSLETVTMESGVSSIQSYSFEGCTSLISVDMPDTATSIGPRIFYGCHALESVTLSAALTYIPDYAFSYCYVLETINLPSGITSIGDYAFRDCDSLPSVEIPTGVTTIGASAFYDCDLLSSINIPSGITTLESGLFSDCSNLKTITMHPAIAPTVTPHPFTGVTSCTLRIPSGATGYDLAHPWLTTIIFSTIENF